MVQVLTMPMMGNTMEIGIVVEWIADEGENVSEGDPVVIVESEKASTEVAANQDGVLASIAVEEGEEVPPGTELGLIHGPDEDISDVETELKADAGTTVESEETGEESAVGQAPGGEATAPAIETGGERVPAAPGARKRAREEGVVLDTVEGTGPEGAVLIADVDDHLESAASERDAVPEPSGDVIASPHVRRLAREFGMALADVESIAEGPRVTESDVRRAATDERMPVETDGTEPTTAEAGGTDPTEEGLTVTERRALSGMRRTIARRMSQSAREKPHVTLNRTVNAERVLKVVDEYSDANTGIGLNDILVCAAVEALETHPEFNAWFEDGTLSLVEEINVGVAVDIGEGLVTPVLRSAGDKTPTQLAEERAELTERVQEGEYTMDDIQGGTFTISNLGMFGVDSFDPIINPPQIAILGVGRIRETAGDPELTLSLSFDHRVVDGVDAARFLDTLTKGFTSPTALLTGRVESVYE